MSNDIIDDRLRAAFDSAHGDPRWAGRPWSDPTRRVAAAARAARRRHAALAVAGLAAVAAAGALALPAVVGGSPSVDRLGGSGYASGHASTGRDWLLTPAQWSAYTAAHPSPSPGRDLVASPAPESAELAGLRADVLRVLPGATVLRQDAADGGERGHALVVVEVDRGSGRVPVVVSRRRLTYPVQVTVPAATAEAPAGVVTDLPTGSAMATAVGGGAGYRLPDGRSWSGPVVEVATAEGWLTTWTAPVPPEQLQTWAAAADAR